MTRSGFSLVELLIVIAIILVLLMVAIPVAKTALMNTSETAVIREMLAIHEAQIQYLSQFREYAATLTDLGPQKANLIRASLASGEKDGYVFTMIRTPGGYTVNANPRLFKSTGRRTFYLDENGAVHENWSAQPATAESPELR
jgi:prepilin-type N-terminal cleavage/methylation domain-containing protein